MISSSPPVAAGSGVAGALPSLRYERKFIARHASLPEVLAMVRGHPALFREVYPPRAINNLYLDSPSLQNYHDHVHGTANRCKTRIRWYGALQGSVARPTLERKIKRGQVSGKIGLPLPAFEVNGGLPGRTLADTFATASLPESLCAALHHLEPTLGNRYRRHYFLSADGRFRLTVDSDLAFFDLRDAECPWHPVPAPGSDIILELKYGTEQAEVAGAVSQHFPFRLTRCSKYVLGIEELQRRP